MSQFGALMGNPWTDRGVLAAGTAMQIAGRVKSADIQMKQAKQAALIERSIGKQEALLRRRQATVLEGQQRASFAARGVEGGSLEALVAESQRGEEMDAQRLEFLHGSIADEYMRRGRAARKEQLFGIGKDLIGGLTADGKMSVAERLRLKVKKADPVKSSPKKPTVLRGRPEAGLDGGWKIRRGL